MNNSQEEFDIVKLIELSRIKKYETTVAGFGVLDRIDKIDIPKKMRSRKIAVQALHALSEKLIQYDYITAEEKKQVETTTVSPTDENKKNLDALFSSPAPVAEEDTEEDELPEDEEKKPVDIVDEDDDYSQDYDDSDDDDDDSDDDDSDDDEKED